MILNRWYYPKVKTTTTTATTHYASTKLNVFICHWHRFEIRDFGAHCQSYTTCTLYYAIKGVFIWLFPSCCCWFYYCYCCCCLWLTFFNYTIGIALNMQISNISIWNRSGRSFFISMHIISKVTFTFPNISKKRESIVISCKLKIKVRKLVQVSPWNSEEHIFLSNF